MIVAPAEKLKALSTRLKPRRKANSRDTGMSDTWRLRRG